MNNLKVYKKIGKKIAIISGVMMLGSSLVGCGKNQNKALVENTLLEQARIITFEDGGMDIAIHKKYCGFKCDDIIYKSIITNQYFSDTGCECHYLDITGEIIIAKENILKDESIVVYLTEEEIIKASNDELTKNDVTNILTRIISEKNNSKTK